MVLRDGIMDCFPHDPTSCQVRAIDEFVSFMGGDSGGVFLLRGYAGTGKTSLVSAFIRCLRGVGCNVVLMAPTGRSAKVFSGYSGLSAYTIHRVIYVQRGVGDMASFEVGYKVGRDTVFFVDECSMVSSYSGSYSGFGSGNLLGDMFEYVFRGSNCRVVLVGDGAQLPPVGCSESPALDVGVLGSYADGVSVSVLSDVVRQGGGSGILSCATGLRLDIDSNDVLDGVPRFDISGFGDVFRISGGEFVDRLEDCYGRFGMDDTIVICRSNRGACLYNKGIRSSVLYRDGELCAGDLLLVVRNNYFGVEDIEGVDFIANGDVVEVLRVKGYTELYGKRFADCVVRMVDYADVEIDVKVMLDVLSSDGGGLSGEEQDSFFNVVMEDYMDVKGVKRRYELVRENEFYNALQVKFAYAVTCHKAQGGQWRAVFVDAGFVPEGSVNRDFYRWLYTAFTRCSDVLYLVNFGDDYFVGQ